MSEDSREKAESPENQEQAEANDYAGAVGADKGGEPPSREDSGEEVRQEGLAGDQDESSGDAQEEFRMRLERLEEEKAFYEDKHARLAAEFDNYKKRSRQEQETKLKFASSALIGEMLGSLDNLGRALGMASQSEDMAGSEFVKGIQMVYDQFHAVLQNHGVEKIESLGAPFDPNCHEAMGTVESEEHGENCIAEVFRDGYKHHGRVIRPAMVQIAKGPAK